MAVKESKHQTLGDIVKPLNYKITFETDLRTFRYRASETISVVARKRTKLVRINARELAISKVTAKKGKKEQEGTFELDEKNEELKIKFKEAIFGEATLKIDFEGTNNDNLYGFYRSKYTYNGKESYLLTSQFESNAARAAFPCFDEPEFKATFDVTFIMNRGLDAISNMPIKSEKRFDAKRKVVTFQTTPKMSSYLLYLSVGKFEFLEEKEKARVKLRVVTTPGKKKYAGMALAYGRRLLDELEKYFEIKFPLPKMDLIAIPDFAAGAMENWGAITFRETALLGDEKLTAVVMRIRIAEVIAHELTHQWFGDLVTMKWWDDLWLNESFATFMGYKMADILLPEMKVMVSFYRDEIAQALTADALKSTHPINVVVNTPGEISSIFDTISYSKGGSVLFMLEEYVGAETFRKGLHEYLKKNSYRNATKFDLWDAIQKSSKDAGQELPVVDTMESWIDKPGYPIVHLSENKEEGGYLAEQKRFTLLDYDLKEEYQIPIHFKSEMNDKRVLLSEKKLTIKDGSLWLKLNYGQYGFYRVRYEGEMLDRLGKLVREKKLGDIDAWGIESDLFVLARSGKIPAMQYLEFIRKYMMDCGYPATFSVSNHLSWLYDMTKGALISEGIRLAAIDFNKNLLTKAGWEKREDENPIDTRTRALSIAALGLADDRETVERANQMFNGFIGGKNDIDTNIRSAIYGIAARSNGSDELIERFLKMYGEQQLPEEKIKALQSIGMVKTPELLKKVLDLSLSDRVRRQDSIILIEVAGSSVNSRPVLLSWMMKNWQVLKKNYEQTGRMLIYALESLSVYADKKNRDAVGAFFKKKENMRDDIKKALDQTLEYVDVNIRFMEANR